MANSDHAVVIGIRTYPRMSPLKGPCNDADAFRSWLVDPQKGAVPAANIKYKVTDGYPNPDTTDQPTRDQIEELFHDLVDKGRRGGPIGRRLYIFMAGHGFSQRGDMSEAALYAANADTSMPYHVAATAYAEWFRYNAVFEEIVLIADFCRTTNPALNITPPQIVGTSGPDRRNQVRRFYAFAVPDGQPAREQQTNGKWRGIFTSALLDAFDEARPNQAGRVRGRQIRNYLHQAVGMIQAPEIKLDERFDIIFAERHNAAARDITVNLDPFTGNEELVILDETFDEVATEIPIASPHSIRLTAGYYMAVIGPGREVEFEVPKDEEITV